jgi:dihydropteroate synthase
MLKANTSKPIYHLNIKGKLYPLDEPKIMGILNLTPDSFFDGGLYSTTKDFITQTEKMLLEGADFIDIGAMSSRPFSKELPLEEELERVQKVLPELLKKFPNTIFSIDTYRSAVAEYALDQGVCIINDITAGSKDPKLIELAKNYQTPYIAMHMQGKPETMQLNPNYQNIVQEILYFFSQRIQAMRKAGLIDIILDVGFGFGKSQIDNFNLLKNLSIFNEFECPILVGISRKSMIYKCLDIAPQEALNGTSALHFEALRNGAHILRVHDVKEAKEIVKLFIEYQKA